MTGQLALERDAVAQRLGLSSFHEHQELAIDAALKGDTLLVSPTGSGKSLAFWAAGLLRGGLTLVISPLRSLMADQRRRLEALGLPCHTWNSDVKDKVKNQILHDLDHWPNDKPGFLYTTPESLKAKILNQHLQGLVNLAVIDEADCVLRDRGFRTSYAWLGTTLDRLKPKAIFACTATLPTSDRRHLINSLKLQHPTVIVLPVSRANLHIQIVDRNEYTLHTLLDRHRNQPGLIFTATVRQACSLHNRLGEQGYPVTLYHGQLRPKEKTKAQSDFMNGSKPIGIATDAFLRGLDKPDIRWIAHYDHPASIEHWLQGFGRAGRDGLPANVYGCFLDANQGKSSREFLLKNTYPAVPDLKKVHEYLAQAPFRDQTASAIGELILGPSGRFAGPACLTTLQRHNLAQADPNPADRRKRLYSAKGNFDAVDWSFYHNEKAETLSRFYTLCETTALPEPEIPTAIDDYFGDNPTEISASCPF